MTELHAKLDLLEGALPQTLVGAASGLAKRSFAVLQLTRSDGTFGLGEASPLPGYSPDAFDGVERELARLVEAPLEVDALSTPLALLADAWAAHPVTGPSCRFALETALLDWLGHNRGRPVHRLLADPAIGRPVPMADLVPTSDHGAWSACVDRLAEDGATHLKLKIGANLDAEVAELSRIRKAHPDVTLRLDANGRIPPRALERHASALEALEVELIEEPVPKASWPEVLGLPLPFALDETLRDGSLSQRLLETGKIRAVVLKPMVLGGFLASFEIARHAAAHGARALVSHCFDGPIARAATAELALALGTELAAGLGPHPALDLWPSHDIAAIRGREIVGHDQPGLGLHLEEPSDA